MAYLLWATALFLGDDWRQSRDDPESVIDALPLVARSHAHGAWLDRFILCFGAIADRLSAGHIPDEGLPTCTGEELALHFVINVAEVARRRSRGRPAGVGPQLGAGATSDPRS